MEKMTILPTQEKRQIRTLEFASFFLPSCPGVAGPTDIHRAHYRCAARMLRSVENSRLRTETVPDIDKRHSIFINVRRLTIKSEICHISSDAIVAPVIIITTNRSVYTRRTKSRPEIYVRDRIP